jgi:hypothetical protein
VVKPVPVTDTDAPTVAEAGDGVTTCGIMFSVALAETGVVSVTVIVSLGPVNVTRTMKEPVAVKLPAATVHGTTTAPTEAPAIVQAPAVPKLLPVMVTVAPTRAGLGETVILGLTLKLFVAESPRLPVSVSVTPD